ncbi:hypothetical protein KSW81_004517 [Nannochloris sp. 'desiccata']|nr:hypothetical protein KSW81_004517 [Chlorella desiccata (nom. nud.)]
MEAQTSLHTETAMLSTDFALVGYASPLEAFEQWLARYNKDYVDDTLEKAKRLGVFQNNVAVIAQHNSNPASTFAMAINEFADLTFEEFASTRLGLNISLGGALRDRVSKNEEHAATPFRYGDLDEKDLPSEIDWREKGVVTPVKNQGMCGSCWAFSTTGSIEGINAIRTGELVSLSEQQLVSCDTSKDMGCGGGLMDFAFEYVVKNGGIDTEEDYGYWAWGLPCQTRREHDRPAVTIEGFEDVPPKDAGALKKALANQPVSVAICASSALQFYSTGVVNDKSCCQQLNHGVLAVGYVEEEEESEEAGAGGHWIVKNSWGGSWGEQGYFRLSKESNDPNGACGILQAASYPVKESTTNPEVPEICGIFGLTECPLHKSCECNFSFFGWFCLSWGCGSGKDL